MVKIETLYNGVNALTVVNRGDYVELWNLNGQPVDGCQWWGNGVIMRYKPKNMGGVH